MTLPRFYSRFALASCALALLAQTACKKAVVAPLAVDSFTIVQGNNQVAQAGAALPTAVVLRAVDANGDAVAGVTVVFAVALGGGTITPASVVSDANGEVTVKWTLGQGAPLQSITAAVGDGAPATLFANALFPLRSSSRKAITRTVRFQRHSRIRSSSASRATTTFRSAESRCSSRSPPAAARSRRKRRSPTHSAKSR